jgi:hypothetical protein
MWNLIAVIRVFNLAGAIGRFPIKTGQIRTMFFDQIRQEKA